MKTTDTPKPSDDAGQPSEGLAPKFCSLFEATASNWDYAVKMAEGKLGKITGHGSDNTVHYSQAGWCKLEWLSSYQEARATDLPTIALPSRFQIVKANDEMRDGER